MVLTTKQQRKALKQVFDRVCLYPTRDGGISSNPIDFEYGLPWPKFPLSYRYFRRRLNPTIGCDGAVTIQWCGMWLCIERDGYVHS
jgi:hypothetical protein